MEITPHYEAHLCQLVPLKQGTVALVEKPDGSAQIATQRQPLTKTSIEPQTTLVPVQPACVPVARCFCAVEARYD